MITSYAVITLFFAVLLAKVRQRDSRNRFGIRELHEIIRRSYRSTLEFTLLITLFSGKKACAAYAAIELGISAPVSCRVNPLYDTSNAPGLWKLERLKCSVFLSMHRPLQVLCLAYSGYALW